MSNPIIVRPNSRFERLAQTQRQVDKLTPSFLTCVFAGQFVPPDSGDKSAAILINRIKQKANTHEHGH